MDALIDNLGLLIPVLIFASAILVFMFGFKRPEQPKFAKKTEVNEYKQQLQHQQPQQKQKKKKVATSSASSGGGSNSSSATKTSPIKRKTTSDDDDEILVINNNSNNKKIIVSSNNNSANSNNNIKKRDSAKQQQNKNNRAKDFVDDGSWIVVSKNDKKQRQINQNLILNEMAANLFQKSSANNGDSKVNVTAIVSPQSPAKGNSNKKVNLKTKELKEKANQKQKELEKFSDSNNSDDAPIIAAPAAAVNNNNLNDKLNSNASTPVVVDNKILDNVISGVTETPDILEDKVEPNVVTKKNQLITTTASAKEKALNSKNDAKTAIKNKEASEKQLNSSEEPASIGVDDIGEKWTEAKTVKNTKRRARRDV